MHACLSIAASVAVVCSASSAPMAQQMWQERQPATSPGARWNHAMAFDSSCGLAVVFGGENGVSRLGDTWTWNGTTWTQMPVPSPAARAEHAMAYDAGRNVVVLFGGVDAGGITLQDTWELNCATQTWTNVTPPPSASSPAARVHHAMAYDASTGQVVLFGGSTSVSGGASRLQDTWEWDGTTWSQRCGTCAPRIRWRHAMAYDAVRGKVVLFAGDGWNTTTVASEFLADTWEWNSATAAWTECCATGLMTPRGHQAMAFDSDRCCVVVFGGTNRDGLLDDTWELHGGWTEVSCSAPPAARMAHAMVYDTVRRCALLFGGRDASGTALDDTWEYTLPATYTLFGQGCAGSHGLIPHLTATGTPVPGTTVTVDLTDGHPSGPVALFIGLSNPDLDLGLFGAPRCWLLANSNWVVPATTSGGMASVGIPIPNRKNLIGLTFWNQWVLLDAPPPVNLLGVIVSNGGRGTIGVR